MKVGKNEDLSVKASEKIWSFWWHMARNPKLSAPRAYNTMFGQTGSSSKVHKMYMLY